MGERENGQVIESLGAALESGSVERMRDLFVQHAAEDFVQEWPQSGERIRGRENALKIAENYPGLPKAAIRQVKGGEDLWTMEVTLDYGEGPVHGVSIFEFRDGKMVKQTDYFADPFEAPEWRSQWVERM